MIVLILGQVSTRFLSASPPIYWFASYTMLSPDRNLAKWGYLISAYFIAYILLGSLLFANFYPFTWGTGFYWIQQLVYFPDNIIITSWRCQMCLPYSTFFEGLKVISVKRRKALMSDTLTLLSTLIGWGCFCVRMLINAPEWLVL